MYWRFGFGISSVIVFVLLLLISIYFEGITRGIFICLTVIYGLFLIYRYYRWNGESWRQVHFRAMLLYSQISGIEAGQANLEGREFSKVNACRHLALQMCGQDKELFVDAMIEQLLEEEGEYFASLLYINGSKILPSADERIIENFAETISKLDFCPQLVIANIIENTYGEEEATKYALALISGKAS